MASPSFLAAHRDSPSAFTRRRSLTFERLIVFLIYSLCSSIQSELAVFFGTLMGSSDMVRCVTQSAVTHARRALKASAFVDLNAVIVSTLREFAFESQRWHGLRVVAGDGSKLYLPRTPNIANQFGTYYKDGVLSYVQGQLVGLYDVVTGAFLHCAFDSDDFGERDLLLRCLPALRQDDLLLLDRGYPALWLYRVLFDHGIPFCMRVQTGHATFVRQFLRSNQREQVVSVAPTKAQRADFKRRGLSVAPLSLRLVRVEHNGRVQVLVTSLLDTALYPAANFGGLYRLRWRIETAFGLLKNTLCIESFTGRTALSVHQDIHATVLAASLVAAISWEADTTAPQPTRRASNPAAPRPKSSINMKYAVSALRHALIGLLLLKLADLSYLTEFLERIQLQRTRQGKPRPRKKSKRIHHAVPNKFPS